MMVPKNNERTLKPERISSFVDTIEKERLKRLYWFAKNYERLVAENRRPRKKLTEGILREELVKRRAETYQSTPRHGFVHTPITLPERDLTVNLDVMKPVPPEVRALIYQGISHEDEGPKKYLKVRNQEDPDDKYYAMECSNMVYGWKIKDVDLHKLFRLPLIQIIQQSFYRRGGVEIDPDNYRDAIKTEAPVFVPRL